MPYKTNDIRRIKYFLCCVPGFNGNLGRKLLPYFNGLCSLEVFFTEAKKLLSYNQYERLLAEKDNLFSCNDKLSWNKIDFSINKMSQDHIYFLIEEDTIFPDKLRSIPDAPLGLFCKGEYFDNLASNNTNPPSLTTVAIIGARECSEYGRHIAQELGSYLGKMGIMVISGMARGIDGISQSAAIESGGKSIAVLGSGVNVCYPTSNRHIYEALLSNGGVISLVPPNEKALSYNFPPRNRIVSGLADAVVVIEARQKSGTLITVDMALEQGKEVFAVPGKITDRLSDGCNGLIGQGASIFLSPAIFVEDLLSSHGLLKIDTKKRHRSFDGTTYLPSTLTEEQIPVYKALDLVPRSIDEINAKLDIKCDSNYTAMILMQLTLDGFAQQVGAGCFCINPLA